MLGWAVCTAITRASVSVTSVLYVCTVCAPVNFVVGVVVCDDDDLLLNGIFILWAGDIPDDAELVEARLIAISPSLLPNVVCSGVVACVCACVFEAAAWTIVRRLISRFPNAACTRDSHCSSEDLHSTCTGWAVAVCLPYRPVFAVVASVVVGGFGWVFCTAVSVVVVWPFRLVCIPGFQRSGGGLRMSLAVAIVSACGIRCVLVRLSYRLAVFQIVLY